MAPSAIQSEFYNSPIPNVKSNQTLFDPAIHLAYKRPSAIHTLADLQLEDSPISSVGSTEPFPFLSAEGVRAFRREIFSKDVIDNCMWHTRPGSVQIRGMAPRYAPFIHQFWHSPEVLGIISDLAGVDLVPVMDYEISHTNVQLGPGGVDAVKDTPIDPPEATKEALEEFHQNVNGTDRTQEKKPVVVPWHRDSHPFVCVIMLSDTRFMTEGETGIQKGDGTIVKVRSPETGGACILQGRHVSHIAIPAENMPERITMVCSFRPRSPKLLDDSSNMNIRTKSHLPELYYQWTSYRLKLLSERFRLEAEELQERYERTVAKTDKDGLPGDCRAETVNLDHLTGWMDEQISYMKQTLFEMRPVTADDNVPKNWLQRGE